MGGVASLLSVIGKRMCRSRTAVALFDPLEARALLTATLSPDGVVLVTGSDAADAFILRLNATGTDLQVQGGGGISLFRLASVQSVQVQGGAGDDTLTVDTGAGLVGRAGAALPIGFDGGAGADGLVITGAPAGVSVSETITPGPGTGEGKVASQDGQKTQTVQFSGVESLLDTSAAASLTVNYNDGGNLVEVVNGPVTGGVATGTIRAFDVTLCDTPVMTTTAAAAPATVPAATAAALTAAPADGAGADSAVVTSGKHKRAKGKAKGHLKKLRRAAAKAQAAAAQSAAAATATATTTAVVAATPQQALLIGVAHVPVQFANKAKITIDTAGGDDWVAVDHSAPAAGLASLALNAGDGQDRVAEVALPAGVAWTKQAAENVSAARDFVGVTECPPAPEPTPEPTPQPPPAPEPPPTPTPADGGGAGDNSGKGEGNGKGDGEGSDEDDGEKEKKDKKAKKDKKDKKDKKKHKNSSDEADDTKDDAKGDGEGKKDKHEAKGKGKKRRR